MRLALHLCLWMPVLMVASALQAVTIERGDVLITTSIDIAPYQVRSSIRVLSPDGVLKGELASTEDTLLRESLLMNGIVTVGGTYDVRRFSASGVALGALNSRDGVNYLAPAVDGSIVAADGYGSLYRFEADGTIRTSRYTGYLNEPPPQGIELAADQCTVYYNTDQRLAKWDVCRNTPPVFFGATRPAGYGTALRMLPDGGFLAAYRIDINRTDAAGNPIRSYGIPGVALALDLDGRSFWTGVGSTLVKVDIESGTIRQLINLDLGGGAIEYLSVAGEPRASLSQEGVSIPALSPSILMLLALTLVATTLYRLR